MTDQTGKISVIEQPEAGVIPAYIGLGSNLDDPAKQINNARAAIGCLQDVSETAFSSLYRSPPMGPSDQPDYVNAVMGVASGISANLLLRELQAIENAQGRVRTGQRWGARTLDLDLLLFGEQIIESPDLIVPHPGMMSRAFVLYPLYEIAPQLIVPGRGLVKELRLNCAKDGLNKIG